MAAALRPRSSRGPARSQQTTLPALLELAVRTAPSLQTAKLDIEIAEAQIQQTWERHDYFLAGNVSASWTQSGLVGGITIG